MLVFFLIINAFKKWMSWPTNRLHLQFEKHWWELGCRHIYNVVSAMIEKYSSGSREVFSTHIFLKNLVKADAKTVYVPSVRYIFASWNHQSDTHIFAICIHIYLACNLGTPGWQHFIQTKALCFKRHLFIHILKNTRDSMFFHYPLSGNKLSPNSDLKAIFCFCHHLHFVSWELEGVLPSWLLHSHVVCLSVAWRFSPHGISATRPVCVAWASHSVVISR